MHIALSVADYSRREREGGERNWEGGEREGERGREQTFTRASK